jgi:hypothetical protein
VNLPFAPRVDFVANTPPKPLTIPLTPAGGEDTYASAPAWEARPVAHGDAPPR